MTRLPSFAAQTEELWPVPVRTGDQLSELSERPVALSFVKHSAIQHPDLVSHAVPLAHQYCPRWRCWGRLRSKRPSRSRVVGETNEQSPGGGFKPSVDLLLNSICHGAGQQFVADAMRRLGAVERPPLLFQLGDRTRLQRSESQPDRFRRLRKSLVLHVRPASWRADTHIALVRHRSQSRCSRPIRLPIALDCQAGHSKNER